jgi:hypothetical protein
VARITIRIFEDDTEVDRIEVTDLPAVPAEVATACRQLVDDWATACRPPSEEESAAFEEAFARQFGLPRQSLDERAPAREPPARRG